MTKFRSFAAALGVVCSFALPVAAQGDVNIYSYREPALIDPLLKAFTAKTGIKTNIIFAAAGLNERMVAEGRNSPADVLLTVDAGRLSEAKGQGLTQAFISDALKGVPAAYRDAEGHWYGLTLRARVFYVSKARVTDTALTYEDLADPKWKGKICTRPGQHVYNTSLLATIIAHKGEAAAEAWAKGFKANLARKPAGGDREAVRDVNAGLCDIAVANTYYMAAMLRNPEQKAWAENARIVFPNNNDRGAHVNISGVALAANAPNKANAEKLIVFLASAEGQTLYAAANNEYPIDQSIPLSDLAKSWGPLKPDTLPLDAIAKFRKRASEIMDRIAFDQGPTN